MSFNKKEYDDFHDNSNLLIFYMRTNLYVNLGRWGRWGRKRLPGKSALWGEDRKERVGGGSGGKTRAVIRTGCLQGGEEASSCPRGPCLASFWVPTEAMGPHFLKERGQEPLWLTLPP